MTLFMSHDDHERMLAERDSARHEIKQLWFDLNADQLRLVEQMVDAIAASNSPVATAHFFSGQVSLVRQVRFNVCSACGKNHDEDLAQLAAGTSDMPEMPPHIEARHRVDAQAEQDTSLRTEMGSDDGLYEHEIKLMEQFGLDDLRDEDTHKLVGFICMRCGMRYPTLDARIQNGDPTHLGCHGCIQKEKFG